MSIGKRLFNIFRSHAKDLKSPLGFASENKAKSESIPDEKYSSVGNENTGANGGDSLEKEYLANLELDHLPSFEHIQKAHRRMIKIYHPDLHATDPEKRQHAEQITIRLNEALDYFETKAKKGAGS